MAEMDEQLERIREKLIAADYQLLRVIDERRLAAFESSTGVVLPLGFRRFITELGNGGAGPTGLPPFEPEDRYYRTESWARPFAAVLGDRPDDEPSGYIELYQYGCGICDLLVVNGAESGNMWHSDDGCRLFPLPGRDWVPPMPAEAFSGEWKQQVASPANTSRISFLEHYEQWLDEVLAPPKWRDG